MAKVKMKFGSSVGRRVRSMYELVVGAIKAGG